MPQLCANRHRFESAERHEEQRAREIHDGDPLVVDGRQPSDNSAAFEVARLMHWQWFRLRSHFDAPYFKLSRYATSAFSFGPGSSSGGMFAPGLISCGSSIHFATFSGGFCSTPAASVVRLPKCVRSGPI